MLISSFVGVTQTLDLVEKLTKANIPKQTATELLEFVELKQTDLVTKDYFEARITAVKDELNAKITGLKLFVGFNTALLMAILIKLFVD